MGKGIPSEKPGLINDFWEGLLDLVYPPKCLVCDEMQPDYLCADCIKQITLIEGRVCKDCGALLEDDKWCTECQSIDFAFKSARSVGVYDGVLKDAIHQFKYSGHRVLAPVFGTLMVGYLHKHTDCLQNVDCIIPVPIHRSRLRQRGFNQSELLAEVISREFALPLVRGALVRTHATHPQVNLPNDKRHENMQNAFQAVQADAIKSRSILLIDDVFTTGSTVDSAARSLRNAGAGEIHVLTLARSL